MPRFVHHYMIAFIVSMLDVEVFLLLRHLHTTLNKVFHLEVGKITCKRLVSERETGFDMLEDMVYPSRVLDFAGLERTGE